MVKGARGEDGSPGGAGGGAGGVYGGQGEVRVHTVAIAAPPVPPGLVAMLVDPTGRVMATATDFDRAAYDGFTLYQAQELRVHRKLANAFILEYGGIILSEAMNTAAAMAAVERLMQGKGYRRHIVPVGHTDKENNDG